MAAQSLLNNTLDDDTLDDGYVSKAAQISCAALTLGQILCISIYLESGSVDKVPFGQRATIYRYGRYSKTSKLNRT